MRLGMNKLLMVLLIVMSCSSVAKKKLYKWVDENGQVHYSDSVPVDQLKKKHEELNDQGVVLEKVTDIKTKEEIEAEKDAIQLKKDLKKIADAKELQRQNIIKSYTNESEITRLKEERLAALTRNIELANQSLVFQKESREQLLSMAADHERNGKEISKALKSRITTIEEKIEYQIEFIKAKESEISKVNEKFDSDIKIYREATNYKGH